MPKAFSEREKELIRARLIEAGDKQFSVYGLKKTNIDELARAAQISKGAFYLFYESKEALFMDVAEAVERRARGAILAAIDRPGSSPRARLLAVLKSGFDLLKTTPILRSFTGSDYDWLFRRVPPEKLQAHLASDRLFLQELVARCRAAGIPIHARPDEIARLLYPLVLAGMHADALGPANVDGSVDVLLELVAAYCVGEVAVQPPATVPAASENEGRPA